MLDTKRGSCGLLANRLDLLDTFCGSDCSPFCMTCMSVAEELEGAKLSDIKPNQSEIDCNYQVSHSAISIKGFYHQLLVANEALPVCGGAVVSCQSRGTSRSPRTLSLP